MPALHISNRRPWLIVLAHFLGWVLFFSIPFFLHSDRPPYEGTDFPHRSLDRDGILYLSLISNLVLVGVFYLNISVICPFFTKDKNYAKFIGSQVAVIVVFYFVSKLLVALVLPDGNPMPVGIVLFNYVVVALVALCYSLIRENIRVDQLQKEKENETLKSELSFLRWQISPHFLFNVLNSMVSLARVKSDKMEAVLLNLSSLMRYMLYETDEQKVSVEREAEYLNSYIFLQNMRFGNEVDVHSEIVIAPESSNDTIEPMLLIPFLENAFKHGIGAVADPRISVIIHFRNQMLTMTVKNKFVGHPAHANDDTHGIGLANVKRRLNLLYPRKHSLNITTVDDWYVSTLGINLS